MPYAFLAMNSNAILAAAASNEMPVPQPKSPAAEESRWNALSARDSSQDGRFVFAVSSTGVYCRPSCPARRPRRENVRFFLRPEQAEQAGYRACLRCRPKSAGAHVQPDSVKAICRFIEQHLDEPVTLERLGQEFRQSPFHLQRRFKAVLGITPRDYADS
ncbi:MAG: Ada metal-binding domain-containing protein, partial [Candidatus Sulfotelmatobacter sp.]